MKEQHDVEFEIPEVQYDFGQDVKFEVRATNKGKLHVIRGQILCEAVTYTGRLVQGNVGDKEEGMPIAIFPV